jgi:hypothetical protein
MKTWLKLTLITVFSIVLLLLTATIAISQLYGSRLKEILVKQLNNELLTKVEIHGAVDITFWKNFPETSLLAEKVILHGSEPYTTINVVEAEKVYFLISFYDLIRQNWNIQSIIIEDGNLNLYKSRQGKINFRFLDDKKQTEEEDAINFNINHARLKNVNVYYKDESTGALLDFWLDKGVLKGNFKKDELAFDALLDSRVKQITLKEDPYVSNKKIALNGWLKIETGKNQYQLKTNYIIIEGNEFTAEGLLAFPGKGTKLDLQITATDALLKDAIQLIPSRYTESIKDLNLNGNINADIKLSGEFDENSNPFVNARIDLKSGSFQLSAINSKAENIAAIVLFNNGSEKNNRTSSLSVERISGKVAGEAISGKVIVKNFDDPNLHVEYSGNLDLALLQPFLLNENLTAIQGILHVKQLSLKANVNRLQKLQSPDDLVIQSQCTAQNVKALINNETFMLQQGDISANYRSLSLKNAVLIGLQTNIQLNLQCDNWKQYLFALGQPSFSSSNQLMIDADIQATQFNWNAWQEYFSKKNSTHQSVKTKDTYNRNQAANLGGKARVKINDVTFENFKAQQLSAQLTFTPNQIFLHNGTFNAVGGDADTKGYFAFKDRKLEINFSLVTRNADIKQIFSGFNNFGQKNITHENLEGKLTADIKFSSMWNSGVFDEKSLYTYADIKIENGRLLNFKPLESLSKFIELEELRNIRFGTLKNVIEIKNQTITIPKMLITSNALSLSASGTQTFIGNINYLIKLNLFDVLGKKFGKRKQQFEFEEVDENNFNLFLNVTGTIEKPVVKYDRSGMKEKFKQQKEEFKQYKEGTKPYDKAKESKQWETKEELEYIEWD